jgi:hypothetical protein
MMTGLRKIMSATVAAVLLLAGTVDAAAQPPRDAVEKSPRYSVASLDDLKARTADEVAQAKAVSSHGHLRKLAEGGRIQSLSSGVRTAVAPGSEIEVQANRLRRVACSSTAVVVARIESQRVMMNHGETWLFTEYTASAQSVLKPNSLGPTVRLSLPSGEVDVAGETYSTIGMRLLRIGHTYIVFATEIPGSAAFIPSAYEEVGPVHDESTQHRLSKLKEIIASCTREAL